MRQTPDSFRIRCEYDSASGEQIMRIGGGPAREFDNSVDLSDIISTQSVCHSTVSMIILIIIRISN